MASIDDLVKAANTKRVQVADLADAPKLQATIQSGGQYSVAVQRAGSNKMLDLADALSKINPTLREYTAVQGLQDQIGEKEAMQVADADIYKNLKGQDATFFEKIAGIDRRNRAFNNTLIKRAINNDLIPSMKAESDALLDLDKYKDDKSLLAATDEFMQKKWEDFSAQVGNEAATSEGARALWNAVTGPFKADMLAAYDKKKDDFIAAGQQEELGLELDAFAQKRIDPATGEIIKLDTAGLGTIAQNREKLMKEAGITDRQLRNEIIVNSYARQVDALIANGRYADADRMIAAMSVIKINGKPIFRSTSAKKFITPLVKSLNQALKTADNQSAAEARRIEGEVGDRFANSVVNISANLRAVDNREEATDLDIKEIGDTFRRMGVPESEIASLTDQVFSGVGKPLDQFQQVLRQAANNPNYPDIVNTRYYDNTDKIDRGFEAAIKRPIRASALSPEEVDVESKALQSFLEKNPGKTWRNFEATRNYRLPDEMKALGDNIVKGDYVLKMDVYTNVEGTLDSRLDTILDEDMFDEVSAGEGRLFVDSNAKFIKRRLEQKAKEVADLPKEERDAALDKERDAAIEEEAQRFRARLTAMQSAIKMNDGITAEEREEIVKEGKAEYDTWGWNDDFEYKTLQARDLNPNASPSFTKIREEREQMKEKGHENQLKRSLFEYGYNSFTAESADELREVGMDVDEVKLFKDENELGVITANWARVLRKEEDGEALTDDEKDTRSLYNKYGIFNGDSFFKFVQAQQTLSN